MDVDSIRLLAAFVERMNAAAPDGTSFALKLSPGHSRRGSDGHASAEVWYWLKTWPADVGVLYRGRGRRTDDAALAVLCAYCGKDRPGDRPSPGRPPWRAPGWPVPASSVEELALKLAAEGGLALSETGIPAGKEEP